MPNQQETRLTLLLITKDASTTITDKVNSNCLIGCLTMLFDTFEVVEVVLVNILTHAAKL